MDDLQIRSPRSDDIPDLLRIVTAISQETAIEAPILKSLGTPGSPIHHWIEGNEPQLLIAERGDIILGWGAVFIESRSIAAVFIDPTDATLLVRERLLDSVERLVEADGSSPIRIFTY